MHKRIISLYVLTAFFLFSTACTVYTAKERKLHATDKMQGGEIPVLGVLKTSGEKIEFSKRRPGTVRQDTVIGTPQVEIDGSLVTSKLSTYDKQRKLNIAIINTKDGQEYEFISKKKDKYICYANDQVAIPMSEVERVWVTTVDPGKSLLASTGFAVIFVVGIVFIVAIKALSGMWPSL